MDNRLIRRKKIFRIVQFGANLGIIILSLLLTFVVIDEYLIAPRQAVFNPLSSTSTALSSGPMAAQTSLNGVVVPLKVNWEANKTTVILNLSTTCHFCAESTAFYQRLVQAKNRKDFKVVAVFPQGADEAAKYLDSHQIKVDQVLNASLASIGVTATPTLMLVSEGGVVLASWRGKLDEKRETEVFSRISG